MSRLSDIIDELRETSAEIARLETVIADNPQFESLQIDLMSIQKRQRRLEEEFRVITNEKQIDVVNYRLIPAAEARVPVLSLTSALETFQWVVSTIFDALKNGPKKRGRLDPAAAELSTFDFGYAGSGSLSVVLTIPNDRLIVGETLLDRSIAIFFEAANAENREQILELGRIAGVPSVRRLYEWSGSLVGHGVDAEIQWRRRDTIRSRFQVESPKLTRLREIIEETSETEETRVEVTGFLVGLDVDFQTFHIKITDAEDVQGKWSAEFVYNPDFVLQRRYHANLIKKSRTFYAYEKEETTWELMRLRPADQG